MNRRDVHTDVIIVGGGPAGAALGCMLAQRGIRSLILERDIYPRDHVGESMVPANNFVFHQIGFLSKMEDAGFVHKEGVGWTAPKSRLWNLVSIRTSDYPAPGAVQRYSYNVERDVFDALLLRHASEAGAKVVQGAHVREVLFRGEHAIGVKVALTDGWLQDLYARIVVDASGRRCLLGTQLGLKVKDADFNQFSIWSWFKGVKDAPPGYEGFVIFHFLGLERAWGWQIPLRGGQSSIGVVTDKADFTKAGRTHEDFFNSLVERNRTFKHAMQDSVRTRRWAIEGDYSYRMTKGSGSGWLLIGDAFRFVDPIFSSGVDVALNSAAFACDAIACAFEGAETEAFAEYERKINDGVDVWYETTSLFYKLQQLFGRFALDKQYRPDIARSLQGNPYKPENQERARHLLGLMSDAYEEVMRDPHNLLRPGAFETAATSRSS